MTEQPWTKRCSKCGVVKALDRFQKWRSACRDCLNAYLRQWRLEHPDCQKASKHQWYLEHAEEAKASTRRWRLKHLEHEKARKRQWRLEHLEHDKASKRQWAQKYWFTQAARSVYKYTGLKISAHKAEIAALTEYIKSIWTGRCPGCNKEILPTTNGGAHLDHIMPRKRFPELALEHKNLHWLCEICNLEKGSRTPAEWADNIKMQAMHKLPNVLRLAETLSLPSNDLMK